MKLNCDLGESFGSWKMGVDEHVMPMIDQANIACGFHAGDPLTMSNTLELAKVHNTQIGAHPSYPDLAGFGRRSMQCSKDEIISFMLYQVSALQGMANTKGLSVEYVKPHGALYNDMMKQNNVRLAIFESMQQINQALIKQKKTPLKLMLQSTLLFSEHQTQASEYGIELLAEVFADRLYNDDGSLTARSKKNAVHNQENILKQVTQITRNNQVLTKGGKSLELKVDSICVHGDNLEAVKIIEQVQQLIKTK